MTYVLTTAKPDDTGHIWLSSFADFNHNIWKENGDADGLSRIPDAQSTDSDSGEIISIESVHVICNSQLPNAFIERLAVNVDVFSQMMMTRNTKIGNMHKPWIHRYRLFLELELE